MARLGLRDVMLFGGWALMTVGGVMAIGVGWGLGVGGLAAFLVGVFGITPSRAEE